MSGNSEALLAFILTLQIMKKGKKKHDVGQFVFEVAVDLNHMCSS